MKKTISLLILVLLVCTNGITATERDTTFSVNGVEFKMIAVEGGTFQMGASPKMLNSYWKTEASPRHQVTLTHDYMIGETEVTVALWRAVMNQTPASMATLSAQEAVRDVTWLECQQFLYKLGKLTGIDFRLPTEAEWEFAARGGRKSKNYEFSGSNDPYEVSASPQNSNLKKWVKQFKPNELGIYDMTGGVAEWVEDYYGPYPTTPQTNPRGVTVGLEHVVRGGTQFSSGILDGCEGTGGPFRLIVGKNTPYLEMYQLSHYGKYDAYAESRRLAFRCKQNYYPDQKSFIGFRLAYTPRVASTTAIASADNEQDEALYQRFNRRIEKTQAALDTRSGKNTLVFPNGKLEPAESIIRNANGTPTAYAIWNNSFIPANSPFLRIDPDGRPTYQWNSFPFVIDKQHGSHAVKNAPTARVTFELKSDRIIIKTYYDYQITPDPDGNGSMHFNSVKNIGDPFTKHNGCRVGKPRNVETTFGFNEIDGRYTVKGQATCDKHYIRFIDLGLNQVPVGGGYYQARQAQSLSDATFQSCWFVAHFETVTFMMSDLIKATGKTRQEFENLLYTNGIRDIYNIGGLYLNYLILCQQLEKRDLHLADIEHRHLWRTFRQEDEMIAAIVAARLEEQFQQDSTKWADNFLEALFIAVPKAKKPYKQSLTNDDKLIEKARKALQKLRPEIDAFQEKYVKKHPKPVRYN